MMLVLTLQFAEAPPRSCCSGLRHMEAATQRQSWGCNPSCISRHVASLVGSSVHSPCGSAGASS